MEAARLKAGAGRAAGELSRLQAAAAQEVDAARGEAAARARWEGACAWGCVWWGVKSVRLDGGVVEGGAAPVSPGESTGDTILIYNAFDL